MCVCVSVPHFFDRKLVSWSYTFVPQFPTQWSDLNFSPFLDSTGTFPCVVSFYFWLFLVLCSCLLFRFILHFKNSWFARGHGVMEHYSFFYYYEDSLDYEKRLVKKILFFTRCSIKRSKMIEVWYVLKLMSHDDVYRILRNKLVPGFWEFRTKLSE